MKDETDAIEDPKDREDMKSPGPQPASPKPMLQRIKLEIVGALTFCMILLVAYDAYLQGKVTEGLFITVAALVTALGGLGVVQAKMNGGAK